MPIRRSKHSLSHMFQTFFGVFPHPASASRGRYCSVPSEFSTNSQTIASVVSMRDAIEAAFCRAVRVTLAGSITPAFTRSSYCSVVALKPKLGSSRLFLIFSATMAPSVPQFITIWRTGSSHARRTIVTPNCSSPSSLRVCRVIEARSKATPPPGTMPSSIAARVACSASSTRAFFSFISVSVAAETEMKEKKARVEDALHATRAAIEEGIVPGGGVALLRASITLQTLKLEGDEQFGVTIVRRACEEPIRQIVMNCGTEGAIVAEKIKNSLDDPNFGFNATTEQYEDLVKAGVIDPAKVTRTALQNAASIASLMLTTEAMVCEFVENSDGTEQ